ncbi:hypothetical protein MWU78_13690 [Arenibacter sp. F26102]|uniref:hypothetical protein n=1 Tax=Arenibacter sp. F26102 TaxID=2926416 RepID=UPI001FF0EE7A|nr:hypothetical protein [Arenibacter sp. F26102]MCK0146703.1 hypothetical protein [Arenibacter sp. F26102]
MKNKIRVSLLLLVFFCSMNVHTQENKKPNGFAIELSLENTDLKRLPIYRNSITSLHVSGDYIIGGTTASEGLSPFIFTASLSQKMPIDFKDIGSLVLGQESIQSGFGKGKNGLLYCGSMSNSKENNTDGGHLFQISINKSGALKIKDLGVPVQGEGIFTLVGDTDGTKIYGISYPKGHLFAYDNASGKTKIFDAIIPSEYDLKEYKTYDLRPQDYLSRSLTQGNDGKIYGSAPMNKLFSFDPSTESFKILDNTLPVVWKRNILGRVDSWAKDKEGILYGGNSGDGQLFTLNPTTGVVKNLGKPITLNRLKGLSFGRNGKLYGVAGGTPGYAHLFRYDSDYGFYDFGNPKFTMVAPGIEQGISWRSFNIETVTSSEDGKYIVMGEGESLSQIMVLEVPQN